MLSKFLKTKALFFMVFLCLQSMAQAEIYKYQDEHGRTRFTDVPPADIKNAETVQYQDVAAPEKAFVDYKKILSNKYKPNSPVELATLSVVTVETSMGSGSGFFITNDCYLITNKHVIRPTTASSWKNSDDELKKEKAALKKEQKYIPEEKERLIIKKRNIDEFRRYIDGLLPGTYRNEQEEEYQFSLKRYDADTKNLTARIAARSEREKKYKKQQSGFSLDSSIANVAKSFNVILKDSTKAQASLVSLAEDDDLALLKINNCKTSFLVLNPSIQPYQGMNIFAVGSPLGLKDHVTAGIVTNVTTKDINTDAQILPGNSGGPLITDAGEVIGVNTLKLSVENPNSVGFGVALPVKLIYKNFESYLKPKS